jgi:hypothetical protein
MLKFGRSLPAQQEMLSVVLAATRTHTQRPPGAVRLRAELRRIGQTFFCIRAGGYHDLYRSGERQPRRAFARKISKFKTKSPLHQKRRKSFSGPTFGVCAVSLSARRLLDASHNCHCRLRRLRTKREIATRPAQGAAIGGIVIISLLIE